MCSRRGRCSTWTGGARNSICRRFRGWPRSSSDCRDHQGAHRHGRRGLLLAARQAAHQQLHELPPNGAAYADRLLSLVTTPFGALEPLGAAALRRVRTRFVPVPAPPEQRTRLIYLSRRSLSPRRNLRNEIELLAALRHTLQLQPAPAVHTLEVFDGASGQRLVDVARRFSQAALLTGPHGGAFLNAIYCSPGTPIVEIG